MTVHNHLTRDIRPGGACPACDEHHRIEALHKAVGLPRDHLAKVLAYAATEEGANLFAAAAGVRPVDEESTTL
jgi:hypothetical protein